MVGHELRCDLARPGEVAIHKDAVFCIFQLQFEALVFTFCIVEGCEDVGLTELPVVDQILGNLIIGGQANFQTGDERLGDAGIEIVRALWQAWKNNDVLQHRSRISYLAAATVPLSSK